MGKLKYSIGETSEHKKDWRGLLKRDSSDWTDVRMEFQLWEHPVASCDDQWNWTNVFLWINSKTNRSQIGQDKLTIIPVIIFNNATILVSSNWNNGNSEWCEERIFSSIRPFHLFVCFLQWFRSIGNITTTKLMSFYWDCIQFLESIHEVTE